MTMSVFVSPGYYIDFDIETLELMCRKEWPLKLLKLSWEP